VFSKSWSNAKEGALILHPLLGKETSKFYREERGPEFALID
jgi:hypothetical protein